MMMPSSRSAAGLLSSSALPSVVVHALGCGEPLPLTGESNKEPIACGRPRRVRNGRPDGPDLMGGTVRGRSQGCHRGVLVGPGDVRPTTSEATICPKRAGTFRWGAGRLGSSGEAERSGVVPGRRRAGRRAGGRGRERLPAGSRGRSGHRRLGSGSAPRGKRRPSVSARRDPPKGGLISGDEGQEFLTGANFDIVGDSSPPPGTRAPTSSASRSAACWRSRRSSP